MLFTIVETSNAFTSIQSDFISDIDSVQQQQGQHRRLLASGTDVEFSASTMSVSEGGTAVYTIVLSQDPEATLGLSISTASGRITLSPSSLSFDNSNWDTAQSVTITAVENTAVETLVEVTVSHAVDNSEWVGVFSPPSAESLTVRVYDNDDAGILLSASTLYVDEGGTGTYTVKLLGSPSQAVTVRVASFECSCLFWRVTAEDFSGVLR